MVKTLEAVDQDKQGIRGIGFGQLVTARDAIWTQRHTRNHDKYDLWVGLSIILDPLVFVCRLAYEKGTG